VTGFVSSNTCFDSVPLANSTAFPLQHQIKTYYLTGTLELFLQTIGLTNNNITFPEGTSIITGFPEAYRLMLQGFSNRDVTASRGVTAQNAWIDMDVIGNYPFDCGVQFDPNTGKLSFIYLFRLRFLKLGNWNLKYGDEYVSSMSILPSSSTVLLVPETAIL
jgi:hypothetical protein